MLLLLLQYGFETCMVLFFSKNGPKTAQNRHMVGSNQIKANSSTHTPLYGDGVAAWASLAYPPKNLSCAFFLMCCTVWLGFCLIAQVSIYCNIINTKLGVVDMYWIGINISFNGGNNINIRQVDINTNPYLLSALVNTLPKGHQVHLGQFCIFGHAPN